MFEPMRMIPRLNRECYITEQVDGTNASVHILNSRDESWTGDATGAIAKREGAEGSVDFMFAGSRTRYLTPGKETDNFGFAAWVADNADQLWTLGHGRHYGEWFGSGIQRGYGLKNGERRFSLFNVSRWLAQGVPTWPSLGPVGMDAPNAEGRQFAPLCCSVVPLIYKGPFSTEEVQKAVEMLRTEGSLAVPGYGSPEGVVVFHTASGSTYKVTLKDDEQHKDRRTAQGPAHVTRWSTHAYMQILGLVK